MSLRFEIGSLVALLALLSASGSGADDRSIQGTLRDTDGVLLVAGEIRAQRLDARAKPVIIKTDAHGQYVFRGLPAGTFRGDGYGDGTPRNVAKGREKGNGRKKPEF